LRHGARILALVATLAWGSQEILAEPPAPSLHWGALGYPDPERTLMAGITLNRFTESNGRGERYDSTIRETIGLNFPSLTWSERIGSWGTNFTVGGGPTSDQPTRWLQNEFAHHVFHYRPVPVVATRDDVADFMVSASLTRWATLFGESDTVFAGVGGDSGSLYHEAFVRAGVRRIPFPWAAFVRLSAMSRYGQLFKSSALNQVAGQSYIGQISVSVGDYRRAVVPVWELELGVTIDSGLFVRPTGNSLEEKFGTIALRFPYGRFELWNDGIGFKDKGPTYGSTLMIDLLRIVRRG
jgi:hypothetical protein